MSRGDRRRRLAAGLLTVAALVVGAAACSDDGGGGTADPEPVGDELELGTLDPDLAAALAEAVEGAPACDWLDERECMLPFPSSRYEAADDGTETGVRLAIDADALPVNVDGEAVDPEPFARSDGWGVGTPIMFSAPGVDPEASGFPTEADLAASLEDGSATILLDLTTGERLAHWTELDLRPSTPEDERTTVLVRPAALLPAGHRIAVGVRQLVGTDGQPLEPSPGFVAVRDRLDTGIDAVEERRAGLDAAVEAVAEAAGVDRGELWLAWDFTVMSTENLTGEVLSMRDQAFELLGDDAPAFEITSVRTARDDGTPLPEGVAAWIDGTFEVPSFIEGDGGIGQVMHRDEAGDPAPNGTLDARFNCAITERQLSGEAPARPLVYGHGLLGSEREALRGDLAFAAADLMACATPWIGMSEDDLGFAAGTLANINQFPSVADRLRQGMVNSLVLARLIGHPDGLVTAPELATPDGSPSIDTDAGVVYEGHSQGGIMGFAVTAISTEWERAIIGVPGVNYSLLIPRSNNWQTYGPVIASGYPGAYEELLILALLQQQWDRAEGSGYVAHLVDGSLPGTPEHQVIVQVALGDHQVTELGAEVAARTAGLPVWAPAYAEGRTLRSNPPFGLEAVTAEDEPTSAVFIWDSGALPAPIGSVSPDQSQAFRATCSADPEQVPCQDPHEDPRRAAASQAQRNEFFRTGRIVDVCDERACTAPST